MSMPSSNPNDSAGRWVSFRPQIRVLDCTIRDGGLMNDHLFHDDVVRAVYTACVEAGVDYMEFGYKADKKIFARDQFGDWKFCDEGDIRRIVDQNPTSMKISVMADAEKTDYHTDIEPKENSVIDMVRVAAYIHQIPTALDMIKDAHQKGYETTVNLMAASIVPERELDEALELFVQSEALAVYIVDSFGAFYGEQIDYLCQKYGAHAWPAGKQIGIHAHNNLQLAFANTIQAIVNGANMLDATIGGLGRGAGNCQMEILLGFLHNPKYRLRPILECVQNYIEPLRSQLGWGFDLAYMITGLLNRHPRAAIKHNASEERADVVGFWDRMMEEV